MSTGIEEEIKRWTAKRKSTLVVEILQGKTTVAEASRAYDLPPSEIEGLDRRRQDGNGECLAGHSPRCAGTVREADQGNPRSLR